MIKTGSQPVAVMGLPIVTVSAGEALEALERMIVPGTSHQVCSMGLRTWLDALADPHLHRIMAGFNMILPDGKLLKWASGLLGCPLSEGVSAVDLVERVADLSAQRGYKIFLLGGKAGVTSRTAELLERRHPGAQIVGTYASVEGNPNQMDPAKILRRIHATQPDILLVDSGDAKQEEWIWLHHKRLGVPLTVGVAGTFDALAGNMRRTHQSVQRSLRNFVGLSRQLPLAFLASRCQRTFLDQSRVTTAVTQRVLHFHIYGRLGTESAAAVQEAVTASIVNGLVMVVHLRSARQVTAAGLGVLLEARRQLLEAGLSLSLTGLSLKTRFLLRAWHLEPLFDEWQPELSRSRPLALVTQMPARIDIRGEHGVLSAQTPVRG